MVKGNVTYNDNDTRTKEKYKEKEHEEGYEKRCSAGKMLQGYQEKHCTYELNFANVEKENSLRT